MTKLTFNHVRKELMALGVTIRANEFNEYRVALKGEKGDGALIDRGHTRDNQQSALEECLTVGQFIAKASGQNIKTPQAQSAAAPEEKATTCYRLGSNALISAPGIIAWAINGYAFKQDRKRLETVVCEGWKGVPVEAARKLLSKEVSYKLEGETVVFEA